MSSISESNPSTNDETNRSGKESDTKTIIRVGSRKSELALVQTNHVISLLRKLYPNAKFEIHKMTTVGDRVLNISLPKIGEKSLFTKDLEDALRNGVVDFVVHSLKDLPTVLPDGMAIGAVLEREDARDALVLAKQHDGKDFKTLLEGSIIGTSSLRRVAQISRLYPHLKVQDIRGNLNTRLAKLDAVDSKYAGIVLAQAGLMRLGWHNRINHTIEPNEILYAVGQGALAVECRTSDTKILEMLEKLVCHQTQCRVLAERSFLKTLGGGCSAPVAVHSILSKRKRTSDEISTNTELRMIGSVWSLDGKTEIQAENTCHVHLSEKNDVNENDDVVPSKKIKLSVEVDDDSNELKSDQPSPPQIIDHSQLNFKGGNDLNQNLDIAGIMSVHNDAFKKCPYSALVESNKSTTNDAKCPVNLGGGDLKCPLHFAVGEDVMGQCPYVDSTNEMMTKSTASLGSCPFKIGCATNKIDSNPNDYNSTKCALKPMDLKKCPFLNPTPSSSQDRTTSTDSDLVNESAIETLFCGIYPHRCWPIQVFEKCEQLGKELASQLIEKGALAVMECAQNEIRKNI